MIKAAGVFLMFFILNIVLAASNRTFSENSYAKMTDFISSGKIKHTYPDNTEDNLNKVFHRLESAFLENNTKLILKYTDSLINLLESCTVSDPVFLARSYYLIGASLSITRREPESFPYFRRALDLLEITPEENIKSRILYFMGYTSNKIGDHLKAQEYFDESLKIKKRLFGENSPELLPVYISISISKINLRDFKSALEITDKGLLVANLQGFVPASGDLALLYQNRGVALLMLSEYKQAIVNLLKALNIYESTTEKTDENILNLFNNIATSYYFLRNFDKSIEFFEMGYRLASENNTMSSFYFERNYAFLLGIINQQDKGKQILGKSLEKFKNHYTENSKEYIEVLSSYAQYLRVNKIDIERPLEIYRYCYGYAMSHPWDANLINQISLGYALSLMDNGKTNEALDSVNILLYRNAGLSPGRSPVQNPDIRLLKKDRTTWEILGAKYQVLSKLYKLTGNFEYLSTSAATAGMMVTVLENIRLNVGEEESRLLLGERYRDSYLNAIESYEHCYSLTGNQEYLKNTFEFAEKSKAASLLIYTREIKGIKYHVPQELAALEQEITLQAGFYESQIKKEYNSKYPDRKKIEILTGDLIRTQAKRDSLLNLFGKDYPEYYKIKYDTRVISPEEVPGQAGNKTSYLSYIVDDTVLYIIIVNRNHFRIKKVPVDSSFFATVKKFRNLLSNPVKEGQALEAFLEFQSNGYKLYSYLIQPVREYFISDRLVISPDEELSFFPFEVLVLTDSKDSSLYFKNLDYMMRHYDISYAYSATLLKETGKTIPTFFNSGLVFAPSYEDRQENELSRVFQSTNMTPPPLIYARQEAISVSEMAPGKLYIDSLATREAFYNEAGKYDIVHLAMHAILDATSPANSSLIFYRQPDDTTGKNHLRTFEIYAMPLNAKMVVLSSCQTGYGTLFSGEGVLSLARGFIVAGSRSVVMSLWEVDDMAGTDIIKLFYSNLRSGMRKSYALKKSRLKYLENADMRLSHPFYWSPLVIYGDNSPLYFSKWYFIVIASVAVSIGIILLIRLYRKRR